MQRVEVLIEVYLRVCGGIWSLALSMASTAGLSPRVRRHLADLVLPEANRGSISACAEASSSRSDGLPGARVYLRVCGGIHS